MLIEQAVSEAFSGVASELAAALDRQGEAPHDDGAPVAADERQWHDAHGRPLQGWSSPFVAVTVGLIGRVRVIADALAGIALAAKHGGSTVPPVAYTAGAAARALLDVAAYAYWQAEPDIGHDERVVRMALDSIHDEQVRYKALGNIPGDAAAKARRVIPDDVAQVCTAYHLDWTWGKANPPEPAWPTLGCNRPTAARIIGPIMPSRDNSHVGVAAYHAMSDVAHGAIRGVFGYVDMAKSPGAYSMRFSRSAVFRQVASVMWAIVQPLEAVYGYLGWDNEPLHEVIADAVTALEATLKSDAAS